MYDSLINVNGDSVQSLQIIAMMTLISLLPSILVMMTSFMRYIIVCSFLRNAMATQQTPPNVVLVGIALFLTLFTMNPVFAQIKTEAYDPYVAEEIGMEEFWEIAQDPLREFMLRNTMASSQNMFCDLAGIDRPATEAEAMELPMRVVIPAFMTSELKVAFEFGFYIYIPFMLIDAIVAATLMSMGMMMLPPSMISMPFKLLLFIALNGWELLFSTLVQSFH